MALSSDGATHAPVTSAPPMLIVVMGVCGCGKSTVGALLARELAAAFLDADDLHPQANRAKMAAGTPLTDDDRAPWLASVGAALRGASARGLVVACSALKRQYRDAIIASAGSAVVFLHLDGAAALIAGRLAARGAHFMPPALLDSQFAVLERLAADERGARIDIAAPLADVVAACVRAARHAQGTAAAAALAPA